MVKIIYAPSDVLIKAKLDKKKADELCEELNARLGECASMYYKVVPQGQKLYVFDGCY